MPAMSSNIIDPYIPLQDKIKEPILGPGCAYFNAIVTSAGMPGLSARSAFSSVNFTA